MLHECVLVRGVSLLMYRLQSATVDVAVELEVPVGFVPLLDGPRLQKYLSTWDATLFGGEQPPPWRVHAALMLSQLLSCASAKFCGPPAAAPAASPTPSLGVSQAFFQRLVVYNPAFRSLSLSSGSLQYSDLLGETTTLFSLAGVAQWLKSEKKIKVR